LHTKRPFLGEKVFSDMRMQLSLAVSGNLSSRQGESEVCQTLSKPSGYFDKSWVFMGDHEYAIEI
jgi:hypothetical protein